MVIIGNKAGQLANRLFVFSHFIANAIENNYALVNQGFDEYVPYFNSTATNNFNGYKIKVALSDNKVMNAISYTTGKLLLKVLRRTFIKSSVHELVDIFSSYDLEHTSYPLASNQFKSLLNKKIIFCSGWYFRDSRAFHTYSGLIRQLFTPIEKHEKNIVRLIEQCRTDDPILVGVHIRRGDYKVFLGGQFYYDNATYADKMKQLERLLKQQQGRNVRFLLCSNEKLTENDFPDLDVQLANNDMIEDLYSLARCDYIIGPPSTFSMWASFYGSVPLYIVENREEGLDISKLIIVGDAQKMYSLPKGFDVIGV